MPWRIGNHVSERSRLQDITISRYLSVPVFSSVTTRNPYEAVLICNLLCHSRFFSTSLVGCAVFSRVRVCAPAEEETCFTAVDAWKLRPLWALSCAQLQKVLLPGKYSKITKHLNTLRGTRRLIRPIKTPSCFASLSEIKREITHLESMLAKGYCFLDKLPGTLARTFARYIYLWITKTVLKNVSPTQLFFSSLEKTDDWKTL